MTDRSDKNSSQQMSEPAKSMDVNTYDQHIRSATSLGRILWQSGDVLTEPGENLEEHTDPIVATLTNLAHCLTRLARENVAVGLLAGNPKITVSSSSSEGPSGGPAGREDGTETLEYGYYATNSPNASGKTSNSSKTSEELLGTKSIDLQSLKTTMYRYHVVPQKGGDLRAKINAYRRCAPTFPVYAQMVLSLFKKFLGQKDKGEELRYRMRFERFVMGMSLVRLEHKLKDPSWSGEKPGDKTMSQFLTSEVNLMDVPEDITVKAREFSKLKWYAEKAEVNITPETGQDLENHTLTKDVMSLLHQLLATYFKEIKEHTTRLQKPRSSAPSEKCIEDHWVELKKLYGYCLRFHGVLQDVEGILRAYISATGPSTTGSGSTTPPVDSTHPHDEDENCLDEDENYLDTTSWHKAYAGWLSGIARQARAAGILTSLSSSDKGRFARIDFDILEEMAPSNSIEPWEKTVNQIFMDTGDLETAPKVKRALNMIANSAATRGQDADFKDLTKWEFKGAIHCEATIAIHNAIKDLKGRKLQPKFGGSKRSCVACSALLDAILQLVYQRQDLRSSTFLGPSNKIWPCALPRDCPLDVAKAVAVAIDEHMRDMLKDSLPKLEHRALKYSSGGSADERSGRQDAYLEEKDNPPYELD